jgi:hypothetical protein
LAANQPISLRWTSAAIHSPHQPALDLGGDPLARMVVGGEQDRGPRAVLRVASVGRHLQHGHRLAQRRGADPLVLDDVAVLAGDLQHLVVDAAVAHELAIDVVVGVRAVAGRRGLDARLLQRQRLEVDAARLELARLEGEQVDRKLLLGRPAAVPARVLDVDAELGELADVALVGDRRIGAQVVLRRAGRRWSEQAGEYDDEQHDGRAMAHGKSPSGTTGTPSPGGGRATVGEFGERRQADGRCGQHKDPDAKMSP